MIPSGLQFRIFIEKRTGLDFVKTAYESGLIIASLCIGNMVVDASGVVDLENPIGIDPGTVIEVKERVFMGSREGRLPILRHSIKNLSLETFEKCSILFKVKEGENSNHRKTRSISRIRI